VVSSKKTSGKAAASKSSGKAAGASKASPTKGAAKSLGTTKTAAKTGDTSGPVRTPNGNDEGGAAVNLEAGEFLIYKVTVEGATPTFSLVEGSVGSPSNVLIRANPTQKSYERRWPQPDELPIASGTTVNHTLSMSFAASLSYRFVVEHRRPSGSLKKVRTDVTWSVENPQSANRQEPFVIDIL
jgi:hypothetical protein